MSTPSLSRLRVLATSCATFLQRDGTAGYGTAPKDDQGEWNFLAGGRGPAEDVKSSRGRRRRKGGEKSGRRCRE